MLIAGYFQAVAVSVGLMVGSTSLDLRSTIRCTGPACMEGNPVAAMWYNPKHPGYLIVADAVAVSGVTWLELELRHSPHKALRAIWWAPGAIFTTASLVAWRRNERWLARCGSNCR